MYSFILASGNEHKAEEFSTLFDSNILNIKPASKKVEVIEDGVSFSENAYKKAKAYFAEFQKPVMSDDSGLNVDALPGELGIMSARFGGEALTSEQRYELLLEKLKSTEQSMRAAHFVCVLCFYFSEDEYYFFEGRLDGKIARVAAGRDGFGYDPVFIPSAGLDELSLAEQADWKQQNSHRSIACRHAQKFFKERIGHI